MQTHPVSDIAALSLYPWAMGTTDIWKEWGDRLRAHMKKHHLRAATLAESLGLAESTVRSWLNGTRPLNLIDFFSLCSKAGADPKTILFGPVQLSEKDREMLGPLVVNYINSSEAVTPERPIAKQARKKTANAV